ALGVVLRVYRGQPMTHGVEVRFRLAKGDTGPEVPEHEPAARELAPGRGRGPAGLFRYPHVGVAPGEAWRHDSDERARRAVEHELLVEDAGVVVEACDPGLVAKHEHGGRARLVVGRLHHPAVQGGHAEELEGARGDEEALEA